VVSAELNRDGCDFVLATRYAGGGRLPADWPWYRRLASRTATLLARPLAPLSDPMSGFFGIHRKTWSDAARLDPIGFKIGLELYVKGRCRRPREVPFTFGLRPAGESKFRFAEQVRYLRHLSRLYWFRYPGLVVCGGLLLLAAIGAAVWLMVRE
jgi:dolichol-phosphate mannosyltransferase